MAQSPKSFFPTANDVLSADLPRRGRVLLILLKSHEGGGGVHQPIGGFNRDYFFANMDGENRYLGTPVSPPVYGLDQPKVTMAFREAWSWLEKESCLIHTPGQPHSEWFLITSGGEKLFSKATRFEQWEKEGLDAVKHKLSTDPLGKIGGTPEVRAWAAQWVHMKEDYNLDSLGEEMGVSLHPNQIQNRSQTVVQENIIQKAVFLSYRRSTIAWAQLISQHLTHRGYDVFF